MKSTICKKKLNEKTVLFYPAQNDLNSADCVINQYSKDFNMNTQINV